jgi:regulatory protein
VRITKIEIQKRNPGRVNIFADGEFLIGLSKETLLRAGLRVGDQISDSQANDLTAQETLLSAKNAALRLLAVRPRSEKEIIDRLREKEFSEQDVAAVVGDLRTAGLVNDTEFARTYIRNALAIRPVGELQLRRKLLLLGVSKAIIDEAVASTLADVDMTDIARIAALAYQKRLRHSPGTEDPRKNRNKISAFLARRGYSWTTIAAVMKTLDLPKGDESDDEQSGI